MALSFFFRTFSMAHNEKEEVLMLNKLQQATIITSISLTTGLVFWAGVWITKQVYWEIMGYK